MSYVLKLTDSDVIDYTLINPFVDGRRLGFKAVVLTLKEVCCQEPMVFLTKEDLEGMIKLFDEKETN